MLISFLSPRRSARGKMTLAFYASRDLAFELNVSVFFSSRSVSLSHSFCLVVPRTPLLLSVVPVCLGNPLWLGNTRAIHGIPLFCLSSVVFWCSAEYIHVFFRNQLLAQRNSFMRILVLARSSTCQVSQAVKSERCVALFCFKMFVQIQKKLMDARLLLARRPPSCILGVLLHRRILRPCVLWASMRRLIFTVHLPI